MLHSIQFIITKLVTDYLQIVYVELSDEVICPLVCLFAPLSNTTSAILVLCFGVGLA